MNDVSDTRVVGESNLTLRQFLLGDTSLVALMAPGTNGIRRRFGQRLLVTDANPVCTLGATVTTPPTGVAVARG
jgi:hypothetical protein